MIGPRTYRFYGLLLFLVVCILLALPRMVSGSEGRHLLPGYDYYTCEHLGYCPTKTAGPSQPEMWQVVQCYEGMKGTERGTPCPGTADAKKK